MRTATARVLDPTLGCDCVQQQVGRAEQSLGQWIPRVAIAACSHAYAADRPNGAGLATNGRLGSPAPSNAAPQAVAGASTAYGDRNPTPDATDAGPTRWGHSRCGACS